MTGGIDKMWRVAIGLAIAVAALFILLWFNPWTESGGGSGSGVAVNVDQALADEGKGLSESNGCTACHSTTGGPGAGPTWKGLFGSEGATLHKTVNEAYIVEILKNPPPSMANFRGKFTEQQSHAIGEYIESLAN